MTYIGVKHSLTSKESDFETKYPSRSFSRDFKEEYHAAVKSNKVQEFEKQQSPAIYSTPDIFKSYSNDLRTIENKIRNQLGSDTKIEQKHFDALVSIGWSGGDYSQIIEKIKSGDVDGAANLIKTLSGTPQRREMEYNLFKNGNYNTGNEPNKVFYRYYYETNYPLSSGGSYPQDFKQSVLKSKRDEFREIYDEWKRDFCSPGVPRVGYSSILPPPKGNPDVSMTPPPGPGFPSKDPGGGGWFGAHRTTGGGDYSHTGLDILAAVGTNVYSPITGKVVYLARLNKPAPNIYHGHQINIVPDSLPNKEQYIRLLYVSPTSGLKIGSHVNKGDIIGTSAEMAKAYGGLGSIPNHVHAEVLWTDSEPVYGGSGKRYINLMKLYFDEDDVS